MSRDLTFKELMALPVQDGFMGFGEFSAKMDMHDYTRNGVKIEPITDINEKIKLYQDMLLYYINDDEVDLSGANCVDVAEFVYDYVKTLGLFSEKGFDELKDTLSEMKEGNGTLEAKETFKFLLNYSKQVNIFKENIER